MGNDGRDLLTAEIAPKKREELQIHNKKLGELCYWLQNAFPTGKGYPSVMLLTGPAGCGKSTAVEVLCGEIDIEVIDYTPELLYNDVLEREQHSLDQLMRFLSTRHSTLNGFSMTKRVLLVTELPDEAYNDAIEFRERLTKTFYNLCHPLIFCLTNDVSNWNLNPDRIFNETFIQENAIDVLSFNPVADTFVRKALKRAGSLLDHTLTDAKLNVIIEESRGDLRMAMNMLQLNTAGSKLDRRGGATLICAAKANKDDAFHMIGRILYAKRVNPNAPRWKRRKSQPIPEPTVRTPLEHDATDIITMSSMSSDKLISFLFENEHVFCSDLKKYRRVVETLSACDLMTADWDTRRVLPDEYISQVAIRSVQWYNYKGARPNSMYAVRRSAMKDLDREIDATTNSLRRLPIVGAKYYSALTAPYISIIDDIMDPRRIEFFVSRPMKFSWKMGKAKIEEQMEKQYGHLAKIRAKKRRRMKEKERKKEVEEEESEDEKFTIEESSDDSFDSFDDDR